MSQTQQRRSERHGPSIALAGAPEHGWFGTPPPIRVDAVQVLVRPVAEGRAPPPGIERWLSDDERARAARFVKDSDRWRFIEAHALLRFVLGHHLDTGPSSIEFVLSPHGKPRQSCPASARGVAFNLSHTVGMIVVALAGDGQRVGVDVEKCGSSTFPHKRAHIWTRCRRRHGLMRSGNCGRARRRYIRRMAAACHCPWIRLIRLMIAAAIGSLRISRYKPDLWGRLPAWSMRSRSRLRRICSDVTGERRAPPGCHSASSAM